MQKLLMGIALFASVTSYGSASTTGQATVKDRIAELKELWSTASEEGVKGTQQQAFEKMRALWNTKRNDLGARIITPLLKDLTKAGVKKDLIPSLEKKMIALFKQNFSASHSEGGDQALNLALYEYLKGTENLNELNKELQDPLKRWQEILDPKGPIATYWQLFIVERLETDKQFVVIEGTLFRLKEGYKKLYKTLQATTEADAADIISEFLRDPIWQRYEIEEKVLTNNQSTNFRVWAISNDGKLYYVNSKEFMPAIYTPGELYCYDVVAGRALSITGLPDRFTLKGRDNCLLVSEPGGIFKVDLKNAQATSLNFVESEGISVVDESYDGTTLILQDNKTLQFTIRNTKKGESYPLPQGIIPAIVSPDGSVFLGFGNRTRYWFNISNGAVREQENEKRGSFNGLALSENGSVFALRSGGKLTVESSPLFPEKAYLPKVFMMQYPADRLLLGQGGEMLLYDADVYFINSPIKIIYYSYVSAIRIVVASSQRNWIAFIGKNHSVHVWKFSASAANQLKKEFDGIKAGKSSSLTRQSELNLLELYKNKEMVDMPEEWVKFAKTLVEKDRKIKAKLQPRADIATMFQGVGQEMFNKGKGK